MNQKKLLAPVAALLASAAAAAPALAATTVTVRVEGKARTLLAARPERTTGPAVVRNGHSCPGDTGMGAFDRAVHGSWSGPWFSGLGFEPTTILGERTDYAKTHSYFELLVNDVMAQVGLCSLKLHRGDQILLADVPSTGTEYPIGLRVARSARAGHAVRVTVVGYDAKGRAHPLSGARVSLGRDSATTGRSGIVRLSASRAGTYTVRAAKTGYIRDEVALKVAR